MKRLEKDEKMKKIEFVVQGVPIAKSRPKFAVRGGFARAYTPKKTADNAKIISGEAMVAMVGRKPLEGALKCVLSFYMPIPKSTSKKDVAKMLSGEIKHVRKIDLDNAEKQVLDAMNEIVYLDDAQIVSLSATKCYSDNPRTEIIIEEV